MNGVDVPGTPLSKGSPGPRSGTDVTGDNLTVSISEEGVDREEVEECRYLTGSIPGDLW